MKPSSKGILWGIGVFLLTILPALAGQKLSVKIIDRKDSATRYHYVAPSFSSTTSNTNVNCYGVGASVNCNGSTSTSGIVTPPRHIGYEVVGATLALRLPDGRIAIVNCESKYMPRGDHINRRSCRVPLADEIDADFDGDKAKLFWNVSIDGKKVASETYKVLGILEKHE